MQELEELEKEIAAKKQELKEHRKYTSLIRFEL